MVMPAASASAASRQRPAAALARIGRDVDHLPEALGALASIMRCDRSMALLIEF